MADDQVPPAAIEPTDREEAAAHRGDEAAGRRSRSRETSRSPHRRHSRGRSRTRGRSRNRSRSRGRRSRSHSRGRRSRSHSRGRRSRSHSRRREWDRRSPEQHYEHDYYDYDYYDDQEGYEEDNHRHRDRSRSSSVLSGLSEDADESSSTQTRSNKENKEETENTSQKRKRSPTPTEETEAKRKRFSAVSEEEKREWSLKSKDAKYINKALVTYVSNKTIEDSILKDKPVPKNIHKPEELDDTWETRLEKRHRDSIETDNALKKVQTNLRNVFGPLTKLWKSVDEATDNQDERLKKEEVLTSLEQCITVIAKVNNDITYARRSRILNKFTRDKKKTAKTLKKYDDLFDDTEGMLFGRTFEKKLKKKGKAKKSQHEVLMALNDSNSSRRGHRPAPFRDGPTGIGQGKIGITTQVRKKPKAQITHLSMSCLQTPGEKLQESQLDHSKINPGIKNLFKDFQQPSVPLAGRLRYFTQNWRKLTNDSNILSIVEGLKLEFLEEPKQNSPPFVAKMTPEKKQLMEQEIQDMLRKGAITPVKPRRDQFLSSVFLREKKDGSQRPIINLKCLNQFIPYLHQT